MSALEEGTGKENRSVLSWERQHSISGPELTPGLIFLTLLLPKRAARDKVGQDMWILVMVFRVGGREENKTSPIRKKVWEKHF